MSEVFKELEVRASVQARQVLPHQIGETINWNNTVLSKVSFYIVFDIKISPD